MAWLPAELLGEQQPKPGSGDAPPPGHQILCSFHRLHRKVPEPTGLNSASPYSPLLHCAQSRLGVLCGVWAAPQGQGPAAVLLRILVSSCSLVGPRLCACRWSAAVAPRGRVVHRLRPAPPSGPPTSSFPAGASRGPQLPSPVPDGRPSCSVFSRRPAALGEDAAVSQHPC